MDAVSGVSNKRINLVWIEPFSKVLKFIYSFFHKLSMSNLNFLKTFFVSFILIFSSFSIGISLKSDSAEAGFWGCTLGLGENYQWGSCSSSSDCSDFVAKGNICYYDLCGCKPFTLDPPMKLCEYDYAEGVSCGECQSAVCRPNGWTNCYNLPDGTTCSGNRVCQEGNCIKRTPCGKLSQSQCTQRSDCAYCSSDNNCYTASEYSEKCLQGKCTDDDPTNDVYKRGVCASSVTGEVRMDYCEDTEYIRQCRCRSDGYIVMDRQICPEECAEGLGICTGGERLRCNSNSECPSDKPYCGSFDTSLTCSQVNPRCYSTKEGMCWTYDLTNCPNNAGSGGCYNPTASYRLYACSGACGNGGTVGPQLCYKLGQGECQSRSDCEWCSSGECFERETPSQCPTDYCTDATPGCSLDLYMVFKGKMGGGCS